MQLILGQSKLVSDIIYEELQSKLQNKCFKQVQFLSEINKATKQNIDLQVQFTKV